MAAGFTAKANHLGAYFRMGMNSVSAFTADASPTRTTPASANTKLTLKMFVSQKRRHFCATARKKDSAFLSWVSSAEQERERAESGSKYSVETLNTGDASCQEVKHV